MALRLPILAEAEGHEAPAPRLGAIRFGPTYLAPGLLLDDERRSLWRDEEEILLTPTEYDLLRLLSEESGRIVDDDTLIRHVWGDGAEVAPQTLYAHASSLRAKLGHKAPLRRRYGQGYLLDLPRR